MDGGNRGEMGDISNALSNRDEKSKFTVTLWGVRIQVGVGKGDFEVGVLMYSPVLHQLEEQG